MFQNFSAIQFVKILLRLLSQLTMTNQSGSLTQKLVFLGAILDFGEGLIQIAEFRILKLKSSLVSCPQNNQVIARDLASVTGQIISMACAVDNVTRLFTRNCYSAIECRSSWDQLLHVSPEVRYELSFWLNNIDFKVRSPKSSAVGVVYSDASDSGFGGYYVQCGLVLVSGVWSHEEMQTSSTFREILAVKCVLLSLVNQI